MPTQIRRKNSSVTRQLVNTPARFPFFQAVRLLERAAVFVNRVKGKQTHNPENAVGKFAPPATEAIRFKSHTSLGFQASEISGIEKPNAINNHNRWQVVTEFLGFTGSTGVLPFHYTELIFKRLKLKDSSLKKFLDLFHHRTVSLFYRAGTKYRLPIAYERHHLLNRRQHRLDLHSQVLESLAGLGIHADNDEQSLHRDTLLFYSGLLSQRVRTQSALEQSLSHYLDVPVSVDQFVGQWQDLIDDVRTRLPSPGLGKGQNAQLGRSALLGAKGWFAQSKIRVKLGPLNEVQYKQFRPGTTALKQLNQMVKMFSGAENQAEYVLHVARQHIPNRIQLNSKQPPLLGWDTWLATNVNRNQTSNTLAITISSNQLN